MHSSSLAPALSVIIVNYNTSDLLRKCLQSLAPHAKADCEIIVVDNGSTDESATVVENEFPHVRLLRNQQNAGFAKANNQGLEVAFGRYVFFLNPDTEIRNGCCEAMLRYMETHSEVGMAGTRILFPDNRQQSSVETRYPGQRHTRGEFDSLPGTIAWLLGASLIVRSEVVKDLGGFDEDYFLYGEDIDLGLKIRQQGWELGFIPDAEIIHWEGQSERGQPQSAVWRKKLAGEFLFYRKNYSPTAIKAIWRSNLLQAAWRIFSLSLTLPLLRHKENARMKLDKYKATFRFCLDAMSEITPFVTKGDRRP